MTPIDILLLIAASAIAVPMLVFCAECLASLWPKPARQFHTGSRAKVTVLIPAHNEATVIEKTLSQLMPTLGADDRVLVVADNCSDNTAEIAHRSGAQVVERSDVSHRGKSYALEFGKQALAENPPDVVIVLDADCRVDAKMVDTVARLVQATGRPVQSLNLCDAEEASASLHVVSALGFRFKNLVRPLGLAGFDMPCHLMGTGMALPWKVLQSASFVGEHLAEDMQFGIEMAIAGHPTLFCPQVGIRSKLPEQNSAFMTQRTRWEQGHLQTIASQVPRLVKAAFKQRRLDLFCLALDLLVPPFSLLVFTWFISTTVAIVAWQLGASPLPAVLLEFVGLFTGLSIASAWAVHCRSEIPLRALASVPAYIVRKLPIYLSFFLMRRQKEWVRTDRTAAPRT
jgi:cellulose synthase/poly-beta-1,6-N-acetylglucosamine synthase-like glycosyltransferase